MSVVLIVPSRGRPAQAHQAVESARRTASLVATFIILAVDADDPALPDYLALGWPDLGPEVARVILSPDETGNLTRATNTVAMRVAAAEPQAIIGVANDDQRFRTDGWDRRVSDALAESGIAYGNDLFQGERLPTAPFITADIPLALGWYALPVCDHLFIDDAWVALGRGIDRLTYLHDVVIEHLHPLAGKGEWDEGYERANRQETVDHDRVAYEAWRDGGQRIRDIRRVKRALGMRVAA